jgi:hypothetical protein
VGVATERGCGGTLVSRLSFLDAVENRWGDGASIGLAHLRRVPNSTVHNSNCGMSPVKMMR